MSEKKTRLKDLDFSVAGAHIALVGPVVGGPANQQETILWKSKSTGHISKEDIEAVLKQAKTAEDVVVEKAKFSSEVREEMRAILAEQFANRYEWLYLEDFSEDQIVFSSDTGMYIVGYSLSGDDKYVLEDQAIGVEYKSILIENGSLKLSRDAQSKLNEGVYSLVTKALDNPETNERVLDVLKSIEEKANKMQEEIQKAVDAATQKLVETNTELQAQLTKASEALQAVEAQRKLDTLKARQDAVAQFDKDGAEAIVKATEALDNDAFATVLKALAGQASIVAESDLMKQVSDPSATSGTTAESATVSLIKSRLN